MIAAGMVVEAVSGKGEAVAGDLVTIEGVSVFGHKDDKVVTVIEAGTPAEVELVIKSIRLIENVIAVYPVYSGEGE